MQEFFMDYGLWLLVGLLVIIGLVFLLSGKGKGQDAAAPDVAQEPPVAAIDRPPVEPVTPIIPLAPAEPLAVAPLTVEPAVTVIETPVTVTPVAVPTAAPAPDAGDNLLRIKGVGPKLNTLLIDLGITRYAQIAVWTDADVAAIDPKLGNFKGRPVRDQWIDQAKYLAAGDIAGFEAKYGKL